MVLVDELKYIIKQDKISTVFQPIINLKTKKIFGFEALSRGPEKSKLKSPDFLFKIASENNLLFQLEKSCRENALKEARFFNSKYKIFLNINPMVIYDQDFIKGITCNFIEKYSLNKNNVVIELTEKIFFKNCNGFNKAIYHYKNQGYKIAIDDAGAGYSGLQSIISIPHNYIKIDRSLIKNIDKNNKKISLIETFLVFSKKINSSIIAEGIETKAEMDTLISLGVDYGQGFYIEKPLPHFMFEKSLQKKVFKKQKSYY